MDPEDGGPGPWVIELDLLKERKEMAEQPDSPLAALAPEEVVKK